MPVEGEGKGGSRQRKYGTVAGFPLPAKTAASLSGCEDDDHRFSPDETVENSKYVKQIRSKFEPITVASALISSNENAVSRSGQTLDVVHAHQRSLDSIITSERSPTQARKTVQSLAPEVGPPEQTGRTSPSPRRMDRKISMPASMLNLQQRKSKHRERKVKHASSLFSTRQTVNFYESFV